MFLFYLKLNYKQSLNPNYPEQNYILLPIDLEINMLIVALRIQSYTKHTVPITYAKNIAL